MRKLARYSFMAGSTAFFLIGLLHTFVHFNDLSGAGLRQAFESIGPITLGEDQFSAWRLWQGISILMGLFSCTLGLSNLSALKGQPPHHLPSPWLCSANLGMLAAIGVVGYLYLSPMHVVGACVGTVLFGLPILAQNTPKHASPHAAASA